MTRFSPLAANPYFRAALSTLEALEPSRETPHSIRIRSRGTVRP